MSDLTKEELESNPTIKIGGRLPPGTRWDVIMPRINMKFADMKANGEITFYLPPKFQKSEVDK